MKSEKETNVDIQNDPELNMGAHDPKVDLVRNNSLFKKSLYVAGAFVVILVVISTFQYCSNSGSKSEMSEADYTMLTATDSVSVAKAMTMYNNIAKESSATPAQRAKIYSAGAAYVEGKYDSALFYIKDVKTQSPIVQTLKLCLEGDCYVNLDKIDEGIDAFEAAVKEANDNPELAPYAMTKLANAYRYAGQYSNEAKVLRALLNEYPGYNQQILAEIARADAMAAQQK